MTTLQRGTAQRTKRTQLEDIYSRQFRSQVLRTFRGDEKFEKPYGGSLSPAIIFVGNMGKPSLEILNNTLDRVDIRACYLTDPWKHNKTHAPRPEELATALMYVEQEIGVLTPNLVVPVGQAGVELFMEDCISNVHGQVMDWETHWLIPMVYPGMAMTDPNARTNLINDVGRIEHYARRKYSREEAERLNKETPDEARMSDNEEHLV